MNPSDETVERLINAAMSVLHHDATLDGPDEQGNFSGAWERDQLRKRFNDILGRTKG